MRQAGLQDVTAKALLCQLLGIDVAAFANEGSATHAPDPALLRPALELASLTPPPLDEPRAWRIVTNRSATAEMLTTAGCAVIEADNSYISFFPGDLPAASMAESQ